MAKFYVKSTNPSPGNFEWTVEGALDENAASPRLSLASAQQLQIDFQMLSFINSKGVQKWIEIMGSIPDSVQVFFKNCPVRLVHQLNLFPSITAQKSVRVLSFYAPYFDPFSELSREVLLRVADLEKQGAGYKVPTIPSASGKGPLEFDAFADKYFVFLGKLG